MYKRSFLKNNWDITVILVVYSLLALLFLKFSNTKFLEMKYPTLILHMLMQWVIGKMPLMVTGAHSILG